MLTCRSIKLEDCLAWDEIVQKSSTASFFQTEEWISLWVKHFSDGKQLFIDRNKKNCILCVFDNDELIGIAPFEIKNGSVYFLGVNPVLGGELVSDFGDAVIKAGREKEVWEVIIKQYNSLVFNFIRQDSPSFEILKKLGGEVEEVEKAPYLDLPISWEEYLALLGRKDRHELKRKIRRLDRKGEYRVYNGKEKKDMDDFFRLMSLGSSKKRNFLSSKMKKFFRDVFRILSPQKKLNLSFLKLQNVNIAATLTFNFKNEVLLYNSGFDQKYSYLSPGFLLNAFVIKQAIEKGKKRLDFLRGCERYKYNLGGRERKLYKITFSYFS